MEILGIIFLALLALFFPRTVLGLVIMIVLLQWAWYIIAPLAIAALVLDISSAVDER